MANYQFVIDSHFQPFTMQEMLAPLSIYKEAFEKTEEAYNDLSTKADTFKSLSETLPEDSKARQIYEGYANDLKAQAEDLAANGLSMGNRKALTSLKRRYAGEIGRLDQAKAKMEEAMKTRNALMASGKPMLYATNSFNIDQFLDGNTPNMYSVDKDSLYAKGAQRGKSLSSRLTSSGEAGSAIGGYYGNYRETIGMNPQMLRDYMQSDEFTKMVDAAMIEEGVAQNLTGADYQRARQGFINGFFDGVVYQEKNNLQRNPGVLSPDQIDNIQRGWAQIGLERQKLEDARLDRRLNLWAQGISIDKNGNVTYKPEDALEVKKAEAIAKVKEKNGGSKSSSGGDTSISKTGTRYTWNGEDPGSSEKEFNDIDSIKDIASDDLEHQGNAIDYEDLPAWAKRMADKKIGNASSNDYEYYLKPYKRGALWGLWNDTEAVLEVIPRSKGFSKEEDTSSMNNSY